MIQVYISLAWRSTPQTNLELNSKDQPIKVTISLSKSNVDYFKKIAKSYITQYQKMIRQLLDAYVSKQKVVS